jgi:hypothetical protein
MKLTQRSLTEITNILSESLKISRYCSRKRMNLKNTFKSTNCRVNWSNWKIINPLKTETEIKIIENNCIYLLNGIVSTVRQKYQKNWQLTKPHQKTGFAEFLETEWKLRDQQKKLLKNKENTNRSRGICWSSLEKRTTRTAKQI